MAVGFSFQKAKREKIWVKILLNGPSGSGKTYTALRLATGMFSKVGGAGVAAIDTENGRIRYYANEFDFFDLQLTEPYTSESYIEAISAAVDNGFKVLVIEKLGLKAADDIDWTMPRVVCIAGDFTKYDESAIKQMNRNISLIRYKKFGDDLLMFEQINENIAAAISEDTSVSKPKSSDKTFEEQINGADKEIKVLYQNLSNYILSLGDDISETHLSLFYQ